MLGGRMMSAGDRARLKILLSPRTLFYIHLSGLTFLSPPWMSLCVLLLEKEEVIPTILPISPYCGWKLFLFMPLANWEHFYFSYLYNNIHE